MVMRIQADLYGDDAVLRASHRFTDRCYVHIEREESGSLLCRLRAKRPGDDLMELAGGFANELIDQALRTRIRAETEAVRRVIVAQAFSRANLMRPETDSADPRVDPLGIAVPDPDPRTTRSPPSS